MPRSASTSTRLATLEYGTYILLPRGSKLYRIITWDPIDGRQIERTATTEERARQIARELDAIRGTRASFQPSPVRSVETLAAETIKAAVQRNLEQRTIDLLTSCLDVWIVPTIGHLDVRDWTRANSRTVLAKVRAETLSPYRVHDVGKSMRALVTCGQELRWLGYGAEQDPMFKVKYEVKSGSQGEKPGTVDPDLLPTREECEAQEAALGEVLGEDWSTMFKVKRSSMVRWAEFIALTPADVAWLTEPEPWREIKLRRSIAQADRRRPAVAGHEPSRFFVKDLKNHRRRETSFAEDVAADLVALAAKVSTERGARGRLLVAPESTGRLGGVTPHMRKFLGFTKAEVDQFMSGGVPERKWFNRHWQAAARLAGLPMNENGTARWTPHDWRHYGACYWLFDEKKDEGAVCRAGGWHSVGFMWETYTSHRGSAVRTLSAKG